jgi:hypothetical protein
VQTAFFVIKMACESHFKTIQQLTCFVMKKRFKCIFFTSDIVETSLSRVFITSARYFYVQLLLMETYKPTQNEKGVEVSIEKLHFS